MIFEKIARLVNMSAGKQIFLLIVLLFSLSFSSVAFADIDPKIESHFAPGADGKSVSISTSINIGPGVHIKGNNSTNPSKASPLIYVVAEAKVDMVNEQNQTIEGRESCNPNTFNYADGIQDGEIVIIPKTEISTTPGLIHSGLMYSRSTGEEIGDIMWCKSTTPGSPAPKYSIPPTYAQIWNSVFNQNFIDSSSNSGVYIAPASPGVTGIPSKFWAQFPDGQAIQRNIVLPSGFTVKTTALVSSVQINLTSPKKNLKTLAMLHPNASGIIEESSYSNPVTVYNFRTKGLYKVSTGVIWTAQIATISAPGILAVIPLGSVRIEINRDYLVNQIRSGLTG
ncbi:MAG: hypothetical protein V9G25_09160 [Acidimicrobiia bacterium]